MSSSDDDRRAEGPADHDPARLVPPADPWLDEAPTSVLGDATTLPAFGAAADDAAAGGAAAGGAAQPAGTARFGAPDSFYGGPDRPPRRRALRWVPAVLAACALFIAGMLAIDQFGSGDDGGSLGAGPSTGATTAPTPAGTSPAPADRSPAPADTSPAPVDGGPSGGAAPVGRLDNSADAGSLEVIYEVTASGSRNTGSVSYTDQDGEIIRRNGIPLPWRTTFPVGADRKPLVLDAQRKGGGDAGPVTCTITVGGKLVASTTATGKYAAVLCSGSG